MTTSQRPLILVTNDDGVNAPGMQSLIESVFEFGDVVVVAPDKPQSGMGHAITVGNIVKLQKVGHLKTEEAYSCSGTPVDCVKLAICHVVDRKPDLLVSGINHGSNNSINVLYSGTMSAAVEGSMEGIPSIGFSLADYGWDADFSHTDKWIKIIVEKALSNKFPAKSCFNVNFPSCEHGPYKGIKVCRQAEAHWSDSFEKRIDPMGNPYFWLTGNFEGRDKGEDTDIWAIKSNYVSIVPVQFDMTAHHVISELNTWNF